MLDPSLLQDFIAETTEHLEEMEENLLHLEKSPHNSELINSIFRSFHTIKGSAEYLGMDRMANLTHNLESLLDRIRNGNLEINREIIDIIILSGDVVSRLIEDLEKEQKEQTPIDEPLEQIVRILEQGPSAVSEAAGAEGVEPVLPFKDEESDEEVYVIFVQNLREGLTELKSKFSTIGYGGNPPDILEKCLGLIDSMASSANYMGYDQLTSLYGDLKADLESFRDAFSASNGSALPQRTKPVVENHISSICKLFDIQESDLDVPDARPEQDIPEKNVAPEDISDNDLETLDFNIDGLLLEEGPLDGPPAAESPVPASEVAGSHPQETNHQPVIYEEDYDSELSDIFLQQLGEGLGWFKSQAAALDAAADLQATVDSWKDRLASLKSSSNYMGYDRLTDIYERWDHRLEAVLEDAANGKVIDWQKAVVSETAMAIKEITRLFPMTRHLREVVIPAEPAANEPGEDSIGSGSCCDPMMASPQASILSDALSDKISSTTLHADTPHEVVFISDHLFSGGAAPASGDAACEGTLEHPAPGMPDDPATEEYSVSNEEMEGVGEGLNVSPPVPDGPVSNSDGGTHLDIERVTGLAEDSAASFSNKIRSQSIRVDASKIDALMNQVGELVVSRAWFSQLHHEMRDLKQQLLPEESINKRLAKQINQLTFRLYEATGSLGRAANELQEGVMRIRMLPVARLFNRYPRLIHDLVADGDKLVHLEIKGEDTELDKMVIEKISDPMIHIIRNAIDHGIENRAERKQNGKPETAKLVIEAYHESNHVVIEVTDDGQGIDPHRIRAKALEKKIMEPVEIDRLTDREVISLITRPGFSTAKTVTHTSGRGVGMDVVKKNIEKLNGTVEIDSIPGQETRIRIKIPLTLAIIPALLVRVETELFTIPLSTVEETIKVDVNDIESIEGNEVIYLRNQTVPLIRLNRVFNMSGENTDSEKVFIVIVSNSMNQMGLVVDLMLGQEEVVIKPLEDYLQESSGFSGATILGDGRISLILDIYDLLNLSIAKMEHRRRAKVAMTA